MALALEDVGAVESGGRDPDPDLTGTGLGCRDVGEDEGVGPSGAGHGHGSHAPTVATHPVSRGVTPR